MDPLLLLSISSSSFITFHLLLPHTRASAHERKEETHLCMNVSMNPFPAFCQRGTLFFPPLPIQRSFVVVSSSKK